MKMQGFTPSATGLIFALLLTLFQACSGNTEKSTAANASDAATNDQPATDGKSSSADNTATPASGCCFTKAEDYEPYIPKGNEQLTLHGKEAYSTNFFCGNDESNKRSSANSSYQIDKAQTKDPMQAKYLKLQIMDYCANPDNMKQDYDRRLQTAKKGAADNPNVTLAEFNQDGAYGYKWKDSSKGNNASNVDLWAIAGSFKIHIQGIDHTRMDMVDMLWGMIPVNQLASMK
jgi:hypothetical protein